MASRLACLLLAGSAAASPLAAITGTKYLFVFGDSYTSTGFNIDGAKPSTSNPLGNPPLPGNTFAGGMTWVGHLAMDHNTSLTLAYDFAVAGATVDNSIISAYSATVPDVVQQVSTWSKNVASKPAYAPWTADDALFAVWIGVNDVGNSYSRGAATEDPLVNKDMDKCFSQLDILYKAGARNFAVLNIPPTNKTPFMRSQANVAELVSTIKDWNDQLPTRIAAFEKANPEAKVTLVDTQPPWNKVISSPTTYGAKDATCISSDGTSCLWFNSYHPGQAIQKQVADTVAAAFKGTFF